MNTTSLRPLALAALLLSGCSQQLAGTSLEPTAQVLPAYGGTLPDGFLEAMIEHDVPLEILVGIASVETGFQMVEGESEFEGQQAGWGVMGLRDGDIELAAELAGLDADLVRTDRTANVVAAAALLSHWAHEAGIDVLDVAAWAPVVARYSGIVDDDEALAEYVHYEVYDVVNKGLQLEGFDLKSADVEPAFPRPARDGNRLGDSSTIWSPSPNHASRSGNAVQLVIIHTCEGSYSGCWSWLRNSSSGVSAHYVVNSTGSEVRHLVDENRRAYHISATYSCSRNNNVLCNRNGVSTNHISVGIEHAGYGSQSSWNSGLIQRSAALTCGVTQRHNIPRDQYHIVGHGQLQPWNRSDPGAAWPWTTYINEVNAACGSGTTTPPPEPPPDPGTGTGTTPPPPTGGGVPTGSATVIDSNNASNNSATHYLHVSSSWNSSANVSGYYNTGYWWASTGSISDPADFRFLASDAGCYKVDAWWAAASDRSTGVTFIGQDANGQEAGRSTVNMRLNGGRWNELGVWSFTAGWNSVLLSRWTSTGGVAIADAVRVTPVTCPAN